MALQGVQAAQVSVAQLRQAQAGQELDPLQKRDATASPRDPASQQIAVVDTTAAQTSVEVEAMQRQVVVTDSGAASHARRETSGNDGNNGLQIGVRRAVAEEGVKNVGASGGMSSGTK